MGRWLKESRVCNFVSDERNCSQLQWRAGGKLVPLSAAVDDHCNHHITAAAALFILGASLAL